MAEASSFVRRLRACYPFNGAAFPYVVVPELHKDGHVHLHLALDRYVPRAVIESAWGLGFVDVRKIRAGGGRESARAAAGYLTKYLSKTFDPGPDGDSISGRHRYEVGQGFQPSKVQRGGYGSREAALRDLTDAYSLSIMGEVVFSEQVDPDAPLWAWAMVEIPPDAGSVRAGP